LWNTLHGLRFLPHSLTDIPLADNKPLVPNAFSLAFGTKLRRAGEALLQAVKGKAHV
jgi:hypothetical protein